MKHLTIQVFGRVQGVFFRADTKAEAQRLGLSCSADNNPDGSVTVEADGEPETLQKLLDWVKKGTATARVDRTEFIFRD